MKPTEKGLDDFWTNLMADRITIATKYQINLAPVFADYDLAKVCHDLKNDTLVDLVGQLSNPIPG